MTDKRENVLLTVRVPAPIFRRLEEVQHAEAPAWEHRNHFVVRLLAKGLGISETEVPPGYAKQTSWVQKGGVS